MRSTSNGKAGMKVRAKQSLVGWGRATYAPPRYTQFKAYSSDAIPRHRDIHTHGVMPPVLVPE